MAFFFSAFITKPEGWQAGALLLTATTSTITRLVLFSLILYIFGFRAAHFLGRGLTNDSD